MFSEIVETSIIAGELGDIRSHLDEAQWPTANPADVIAELNLRTEAEWDYSADEGWSYVEKDEAELHQS